MNSVPYSGPEAPPTFITSSVPIARQCVRQRFVGERGGIGADGFEPALHVQSVVAVADRLVERGEFVGVVNHHRRDRFDQAMQCRGIDGFVHALTLVPA